MILMNSEFSNQLQRNTNQAKRLDSKKIIKEISWSLKSHLQVVSLWWEENIDILSEHTLSVLEENLRELYIITNNWFFPELSHYIGEWKQISKWTSPTKSKIMEGASLSWIQDNLRV